MAKNEIPQSGQTVLIMPEETDHISFPVEATVLQVAIDEFSGHVAVRTTYGGGNCWTPLERIEIVEG